MHSVVMFTPATAPNWKNIHTHGNMDWAAMRVWDKDKLISGDIKPET